VAMQLCGSAGAQPGFSFEAKKPGQGPGDATPSH